IHSGEIVGLVGLRGAGQEQVGRALFGLEPITGGRATLEGVALAPCSPIEAMRQGVSLIGADRVAESVLPTLTVRENMFVNPLAAGRRLFSYLVPREEGAASRTLGEKVGLRPNDPDMAIEL